MSADSNGYLSYQIGDHIEVTDVFTARKSWRKVTAAQTMPGGEQVIEIEGSNCQYHMPPPSSPFIGRLIAVEYADGHRRLGRLAGITHDQDGTRLTITEEP